MKWKLLCLCRDFSLAGNNYSFPRQAERDSAWCDVSCQPQTPTVSLVAGSGGLGGLTEFNATPPTCGHDGHTDL